MDFWTADYTDLQLMHAQKIYPPAMPFVVHSPFSPIAVEIAFEVEIAGSESFTLTILKEFNSCMFFFEVVTSAYVHYILGVPGTTSQEAATIRDGKSSLSKKI